MMKMLVYLIVAGFLPSLILGGGFNPCAGGLPFPTAVRLHGCIPSSNHVQGGDSSSSCHVNRGDTVIFEADFTATSGSGSLTLSMEATTFGNTTPFPISPDIVDACNGLVGATCPVATGQALTHATTINVGTQYHDGVVSQFRIQINHENGETAVCYQQNIIIH